MENSHRTTHDYAFFEVLNEFNFEGVTMEDLRQFISEETDYENPFNFFVDLFSYCQEVGFSFKKDIEKTLISFVFDNINDILSDIAKEENKTFLLNITKKYILQSDNKIELLYILETLQ